MYEFRNWFLNNQYIAFQPTKIDFCLKKCLLLQRKIGINDKGHLMK
jgi:hypothetical protein